MDLNQDLPSAKRQRLVNHDVSGMGELIKTFIPTSSSRSNAASLWSLVAHLWSSSADVIPRRAQDDD
jgi:hypothetical protein